MELLLDEGSFREYDMFVEHTCTDFGMDDPSKKVGNYIPTSAHFGTGLGKILE